MILTKQTVIKWKSIEDVDNEISKNKRQQKLQEMKLSEKTDGIRYLIDNDLTRIILFIDQAAAQEWVDFVQTTAEEQDIKLVSTEILDI